MTLNELIEQLLEYKEEGYGNAPVYVYADHGQTFIKAGCASVEFTEQYEYYAEQVEDWDEESPLPFICVGD